MNEEDLDFQEEKEKRSKRRRKYMKLNILSLFFIAVSFISVTLAWFAYSGLVTTQTEVNVKAWFIEFNNKGNAVSNDIVISLNDISPGMEIKSETIDIKNSGDSDAMISYKIKSVRILDEEYEVDEEGKIVDKLSHDFPFHINMSLSKYYANAHDGTGNFTVSVSWPLDSDNDSLDTEWGMKAYDFQANEAEKLKKDSSYQVKSTIEVKISLEAVQYIGEGTSPDPNYILGNIQLYDVVNNTVCSNMNDDNCIKTYVIDVDNKLSDTSVTLLPDLYGTYASGTYSEYETAYNTLTSNWTVTHRKLSANDLLPVISKDINSSVMVGTDISNQLVGYIDTNNNRITDLLSDTIKYNGHIRFKNELFTYFSSSSCYWLDNNYDTNSHFALVKVDDLFSKIYPESKTNSCKVVPVIEVSKAKLNVESSS